MYLHKLSSMEYGTKIPLEFHAHVDFVPGKYIESKIDELWRLTFVKYKHGQRNNE